MFGNKKGPRPLVWNGVSSFLVSLKQLDTLAHPWSPLFALSFVNAPTVPMDGGFFFQDVHVGNAVL
jgi:hypothetical protein